MGGAETAWLPQQALLMEEAAQTDYGQYFGAEIYCLSLPQYLFIFSTDSLVFSLRLKGNDTGFRSKTISRAVKFGLPESESSETKQKH